MLANVVVVTLAVLTGPVLGGSRAWEAPLRHEVQLDRNRFARIAVDDAGYAIRRVSNNSTDSNNIKKRWFGVRSGDGPNPTKLWPDKTISYCYDTADSKTALEEALQLAFNMWSAGFEDGTGGLNRLVYKYEMVEDPGTACTGSSIRDKVLVVSHNDLGVHATTVGRPPLNAKKPEYKGPSMMLSTNDNVGQLNRVANFAHEVGHAWGLYHEHQNPLFWRFPYGIASSHDLEGQVFGDHWDCSALKDFFLVRGKIIAKHGDGPEGQQIMRDVCERHAAASEWGFSAADWLPIKSYYRHTSGIPNAGAGYDHVDWDSIMLYPSGAGGIGTARPPTNPAENPDAYDGRTPVLLRNDGAKIHTNAIPSKRDVEGIKFLYENNPSEAEPYTLPNDKKSKWYTNFIKDITGKKGKSCENPN